MGGPGIVPGRSLFFNGEPPREALESVKFGAIYRTDIVGCPLRGSNIRPPNAGGQCWHWFDRPRATAEAGRLLVADGKLVICHFDWLPLPGNMVRTTEKLIERHNPNWKYGKGTGIYPWWPADLSIAGFRDLETFSFDLDVPYSHEDWRGRVRASAGVGASLPADRIAEFDDALAALLAAQFPAEPLAVPHRVWALIARAPVAEG